MPAWTKKETSCTLGKRSMRGLGEFQNAFDYNFDDDTCASLTGQALSRGGSRSGLARG